MRHRTLRAAGIIAVAATVLLSWTSGAQASAPYCPADQVYEPQCQIDDTPAMAIAGRGHIGWVYLNLNYCEPGLACIAMVQQSTGAWRWSGRSWSRASISGGWVYVYPYTGAWRWAWTQDSGWVAMDSGRFEIRHY